MSGCELYQELISRMIDEDLNREEQALLESHLQACPACRTMYAAFADLSMAVGSDLEEPPEALRENVMAQIRRAEIIKKNKTNRRLSRPMQSLLAGAACMVFLIGATTITAPLLRHKAAVSGGGTETSMAAATQRDAGTAVYGSQEAVVSIEAGAGGMTEMATVPVSDTASAPAMEAASTDFNNAPAPEPAPAAAGNTAEDNAAPASGVVTVAPEEGTAAPGEAAAARDTAPVANTPAANDAPAAHSLPLPSSAPANRTEDTEDAASTYIELWSRWGQNRLSRLLDGKQVMAIALPGKAAAANQAETEEEKEEKPLPAPEDLDEETPIYVFSLDEKGQHQIRVYSLDDEIYYVDSTEGEEPVVRHARCTLEELDKLFG